MAQGYETIAGNGAGANGSPCAGILRLPRRGPLALACPLRWLARGHIVGAGVWHRYPPGRPQRREKQREEGLPRIQSPHCWRATGPVTNGKLAGLVHAYQRTGEGGSVRTW